MSQHPAFLLIDRAAALFCGVVAGIAIGLAFAPQLGGLVGTAPPMAPGAVVTAPATAPAKTLATAPSVLAMAPAGLASAVAENRPFRIGVFGDSFGDGLWAGLYNQLPRREAFQVLRFSEQATGFTRYRQRNLQERLVEQLAEGPVDVAVISFGANDTQGVWADGRAYALLSAGWKAEISQRAAAYVKALQAQGATVVWIGLPVMRDRAYDAQIAGMNQFYAALMDELGVAFVDTSSAAADAQGRYAAYLPGPDGTPFLARAGDGVHMSGRGYQRLTAAFAAQLRRHARAARRGEAVPANLVPPPAPPPVMLVPRLAKPMVYDTSQAAPLPKVSAPAGPAADRLPIADAAPPAAADPLPPRP